MMLRTIPTLLLTFCFCGLTFASPLDEQIKAFNDPATPQDESRITKILKAGADENRSAEALAAVQPWLNRNDVSSDEGLYYTALTSERSGHWLDAIGNYQRLLQADKPNPKFAGPAADATYRLLLTMIDDDSAAYLFSRKDGNRIRPFGQAKRYDLWFLEQAKTRRDLIAMAERLAAIASDSKAAITAVDPHVQWLCQELEQFRKETPDVYEAAARLALAEHLPTIAKARLNWVATVMPYNMALDTLRKYNTPADPKLTDAPLAAAAQLIQHAPDQGPLLVAKGWGVEYDGHHGTCAARFQIEGERKIAQLLAAVPRMSPEMRDDLLAYPLAQGRIKFDALDIWPLVIKYPELFNSLNAAPVPIFDKTKLTVEQAKQLAPHLARSPHPDAALIRAIAASDSLAFSPIAQALLEKEAWRFNDTKSIIELAWANATTRENDQQSFLKQYPELPAPFGDLKKQIAKNVDSTTRRSAFNKLRQDLLADTPSIPGALSLWDELFANAPNDDTVYLVTQLTADITGDHSWLLQRALSQARFGDKRSGSMPWQAVPHPNQYRYHRAPVQKDAGELIKHLQGVLQKQLQGGELHPMVLGMWLHTVNPADADAQAFMKQLVASPAYRKLPADYRTSAADSNHFDYLALDALDRLSDSRYVSEALIDLPDDASGQAVEAALAEAIKRAAAAPQPVAIIGLDPVAKQTAWSDKTRQMVLSLFKEHAPAGAYPTRQGYEPVLVRLAEQYDAGANISELEPFAAGLWSAALASDDARHYRGAAALISLAERALDAGSVSIALSLSRSGSISRASQAMAARTDEVITKLRGRNSQVQGKASIALGIIDIPVDELDPAYPLYKSQAEFAIGNLDAAWELYEKHAEQIQPIIRKLTVPYCLWLLERDIEARESDRAEALIKELTVWSRQATGTFTATQEGELKIAYADAAFQKGALQTAKAWYRRVADAQEYSNTPLQYEAQLRSVRVDRASKDFGSALAELDKLMLVRDTNLRTRVHFARAEVFYDQERYADAFNEASAVLKREPSHPDALIMLGQAQLEMRKLVDASEIELGVSRDQKLIVPGEVIKINLSDPALNISGVGADIEVEIWTQHGDRERVMLYQLGDDKTKFRAEIPTQLGKRQPGDKVLQVLGQDEIRYGYSKRFREKMADLPPDSDIVITVASDAFVSASAGAFPPREGERQLDLQELGVSTAQQALGMSQVRPGNPVYLRVTDPDQGKTDAIDQITVSIQASNGDSIPRLILTETGTHTGEFEGTVPTGPSQALAYASESAPGTDPNMVISAEAYPGWAGAVGSKAPWQFFTVDLNDNVLLGKMSLQCGEATQALTHFVLQTSMNGSEWTTRARYPKDNAPWAGKPQLTAFPTFGRNAITISEPTEATVPEDWYDKMELASASSDVNYGAFTLTNLNDLNLELPSGGHPGYSLLVRYRALFYQPAAEIRTFQLKGLPNGDGASTRLLLNGQPASNESDDPLTITRELVPGLHMIEFWRHESRNELLKRKPILLQNVDGQAELAPCPDSMFDPATFPAAIRESIPDATSITTSGEALDTFAIDFGQRTRARLVRLAILEHQGPAPAISKITLTDHEGNKRLPVAQDYNKLRSNDQLEVVPGDRITVRYEDDRVITERKKVQQKSLSVAYNTATINASFLTYINTETGRELVIEPIRRFKLDDSVGIVITDADLDQSAEPDQITVQVKSSSGSTIQIIALETGPHTGEFIGKVFPVSSEPKRDSEILVAPGGTITAIYRDMENLDPGIPTDRTVTIEHALFKQPQLAVYHTDSQALPQPERDSADDVDENERGTEIVKPRQVLNFVHLDQAQLQSQRPEVVIGSSLRFDVLASQMAFAQSSKIIAYVQTESGRRAHQANGNANSNAPFDIRVPGTLRLSAMPSRSAATVMTDGYTIGTAPAPPHARQPLDEGRFAFTVPISLDTIATQTFATEEAQTLPSSMRPEALAVRPGDIVHIGFAYLDPQGKPQWITASTGLTSNAMIDVMNSRYRRDIVSAFVGEKLFVRVIAPDQDKTPERDEITINLKAKSGVNVAYPLLESEVHSGVFKGSFELNYASEPSSEKLPSVALHGLPVKYGDTLTVSYADAKRRLALDVSVNKGADGTIEPFTKQYGEDGVAVQTTFTLAECFFELAKHHREMQQESLARREMAHAQKLLAEAVASHHDEDLQAQAEYLLGNLAQEYADLSENDASKTTMYQDALARFSKIPLDYPDSEFAPKAQFKKGLVYEKLGEVDIAVEEYVKLAYKYPDHELIPSVMSRLGAYFQSQGAIYKAQAESLEQDKDNTEAIGEAIKQRELATKEYRNAAQVFAKLQERFPNDPLAGLAGLRSAQNYLRASDYREAINGFQIVIDTETYDDKTIRSQAMFWSGISHERLSEQTKAYELYRRVTFDFPDSVWAKQARGRLADPAFAQIIAQEKKAREEMLDALKKK